MPKKPDPRFPKIVEVVVEIPQGSRNKYEFDEKAGVMRLDRVLSSAVFYNFEYGFIDGTLADDGDHTDALILLAEPTFPGCHVTGLVPSAVCACATTRATTSRFCASRSATRSTRTSRRSIRCPHNDLREIEHFFATYKLLEDKTSMSSGWTRHRPGPPGAAEDDRERWLAQMEPTATAAEPTTRPVGRAAMAKKPEMIEVAGSRSGHHQPGQGLLPRERGYTKGDLVDYYLAVADGALRGAGGRPDGAQALRQRRRAASSSSRSARRSRGRTGSRRSSCHFPSGRTAAEIVLRDAAQLALDHQPRLHRSEPASGPRRGPRPSRRAARRPRSGARRAVVRTCARWRWSRRVRSRTSG